MAAGTTVARINTIVTANTAQFDASMRRAQTTAGRFAARAGAAAKAASGPLTLGLIGAGTAAVKAATQFDDSMTKIESLVGIAGSEVDKMKDSVRALSGETAQAPAQLADAMFFIQSAGLRGATAMETLEASAKAAAVGLGQVEQIADLATSALNAYGEENISAVDATDVLTAAVREGKLEASELAGSMGRVLPIASAMGVQFHEVGAAFAALSRTGTNAAEAATQVRGILSSLLRPTQQAEEALTNMGLSSEGLRRQIREEGLLATLQTLAEEFDGNAAASASVFGNVRALSGVMDLMGANVATTEQIFANMADTTGTLDEAFGVVSETAGFQFQQAMADLQELLIGIGEQVLPVVMEMVEGFQAMLGFVKDLPGPVKALAAGLAAIVVLSGPLGIAVTAIGGLAYALGRSNDDAQRAAELQAVLTDEFVKAGDPTIHLADRIRELADAIGSVGDESENAVPEIDGIIGEATVFSTLLANDMLPVLDILGMDLERFTEILQQGGDAFDETGGMAHQLTNMLYANRDAHGDLYKDTEKVVDIARDLAETFDAVTANTEAQNQALLDDATAFRVLEDAGYDAERVLTEFDAAGMSATEQLLEIEKMVASTGLAMRKDLNPAAQATVGVVGDLADEVANAEDPTLGLAEALDEATDSAQKFEDQYRDLMRTVLGEGEALLNAQELATEFDEIVSEISEKTLLELGRSFYDMSEDAAAAIGRLVDEGARLDSPEVQAVFDNFISNIALIGLAGDRTFQEIADAISQLESMAGIEIPIEVRFELFAEVVGGEDVLLDQIGQIYGSTSFTPSAPASAPAPTPFNPADYPFAFGAAGGIVRRPTMALIGEAGPEAVVPLNQMPGASPLPAGGMGGTTNITINMPTGSNGDDVVRALQDYTRRRGSLPLPVGSARY